jgi:dihydroorotate dehydrogenase
LIDLLASMARPALLALDPERAHELTLRALELAPLPQRAADESCLRVTAMGLDFPNPLGIAAGFDKDARVPGQLLRLGFGHVEVGSVTPRPQPGNPKPRLFRIPEDGAVINRMGFNSIGHAAVAARLSQNRPLGIVGINLGANGDSADRIADMGMGVSAFARLASYLTINISSPNTPGLRDLQGAETLSKLIAAVMAERDRQADHTGRKTPIVIKLSPDLAEADLPGIAERLCAGHVDGVAVSNTTLARDGLSSERWAREAGGLSGQPLFRRSTRQLARMHRLLAGRIPLIGIGGIASGKDAVTKIAAGANLIQLYTGLVFAGPGLIEDIKSHIVLELRHRKLKTVRELTGLEAASWSEAAP